MLVIESGLKGRWKKGVKETMRKEGRGIEVEESRCHGNEGEIDGGK